VGHVLHDRLADAHVDAALDLPLDEHGVERLAAVVRRPDLVDAYAAGRLVDLDLDDVGGGAVGGRRADGAAAVVGAGLYGLEGADGAERAGPRLGEPEHGLHVHGAGGVEPIDVDARQHQNL